MNLLSLSVALTLLPLYFQLPSWVLIACLFLIALSFKGFKNKWLLQFLAVASAAGVFLQYGTLFSREAGMSLLSLLVCLKLAESGKKRDACLVVMLCYFLIMTWLFDSQSIWVAFAMMLMILLLTANLVQISNLPRRIAFLESAGIAFRLLAHAAPISLFLFLLFPRIPGPIWALPKSSGHALSGLSDRLSPGSISDLVLSDSLAFRANFAQEIPERSRLYWRGPVFWDYDGKAWSRGKPIAGASFHASGNPVRYSVTMEPSRANWLFGLDMPIAPPPGSMITPDREIVSAFPVKNRMRYDMISILNYEQGANEPERNLDEALRIPQGIDPKARALANSWKGETAGQIVRHAIDFFRSHRFVYTLKPPMLEQDEVDDFLFRTRSGFCEHYASSFAFLMRAAGIPARIVTGYQGGEINPLDREWVVRQSDAHAWVEIWEEGRGWLRVDPTAIVAPTRIESGLTASLPGSSELPLMMRRDSAWLRRLRFGYEAASYAWSQWVTGFDEEKQRRLFDSLGMKNATLRDIAAVFSIALSLFFLASTSLLLFRIRRKDRVELSYLLFCKKMAKLGLERRVSEGPLDYWKRISSWNPEMASKSASFMKLYIELRYGKNEKKGDAVRLYRMAKSLR